MYTQSFVVIPSTFTPGTIGACKVYLYVFPNIGTTPGSSAASSARASPRSHSPSSVSPSLTPSSRKKPHKSSFFSRLQKTLFSSKKQRQEEKTKYEAAEGIGVGFLDIRITSPHDLLRAQLAQAGDLNINVMELQDGKREAGYVTAEGQPCLLHGVDNDHLA